MLYKIYDNKLNVSDACTLHVVVVVVDDDDVDDDYVISGDDVDAAKNKQISS
jgi:hypothetical protein